MKTLYLECNMGTAGDILMSALAELLPDPEKFISKMNSLGLPGVRLELHKTRKSGIGGSHVRVMIDGEEEQSIDVGTEIECTDHHHAEHEDGHHEAHGHHGHDGHRGMHDIWHIINDLSVSEKVKTDALAVYDLIAKAESAVHGEPVDKIHFHEVGSLDAIADIVGVCLLLEEIGAEKILASPIHVGFGQIRCAHGILPVPAPATAEILRGVPIYGGTIRGELCTPTGAALVKHFAEGFTSMPPMSVQAIGYGMGNKDFEAVNCMRAFLGETEISGERENFEGPNDEIAELSCNLDDMTGEQIGFAAEEFLANGALDAFTQPIQMKKNRPGQMLTCLCRLADADRMAQLMLAHTTTFGIRRTLCSRYILDRKMTVTETVYGPVRIKTGTGYGIIKAKPEYEDIAKAARENEVTFAEISNALKK